MAISMSGSGEGPGWVTAPAYSTAGFSLPPVGRKKGSSGFVWVRETAVSALRAVRVGDGDEVRRAENRELVSQGDDRLKKTKDLWLTKPDRMSSERWQGFASLRDCQLRVA